MQAILDAALDLAEQGAAIVLLKEGSKRPVFNNWTRLERYTSDRLERAYHGRMNIGVRLGAPSEIAPGRFLYGCDMDVRDLERASAASKAAWAALLEKFPVLLDAPRVISGSGGESRHIYFVSDAVFRKVNIARADYKVTVQTPDGPKEKFAWELDFYGTGAQMVLPPSIHPDTGKPYRWEWDEIPPLDVLPFIPAAEIEVLFEKRSEKRDRSEIKLLPIDDLEDILFRTDAYDNRDGGLDYDSWRDVLFAVKHEYDGTDFYDEAYDLVEEWSRESEKHSQRRFEEVFSHAKSDRDDAVTMGSLIKKWKKETDKRYREDLEESFADERSEEDKANPEAAAQREKAVEWKRRLEKDNNGVPKPTESNIDIMLEHEPDLRDFLWFDIMEQRPVWRKFPGETLPDTLDILPFRHGSDTLFYDPDTHYRVIQKIAASASLHKLNKGAINDGVNLVSQLRPFNRLLDRFTREEWDGTPRIEFLLRDYMGAEDSVYCREVSKLLCLAVMGRILEPGVKFDQVIILEGAQGCGKDTFLQTLVEFGDESFFCDTVTDVSNPAKYVEQTRGKVLVHLSEMSAYSRHEIEAMKAFITTRTDTARVAYGRSAFDYRRSWVLVASTNKKSYLRDATGDRRYLPVVCGDPKFGPDGVPTAYAKMFRDLEKERGQIWAEAYHILSKRMKESLGGRLRAITLGAAAVEAAREMQAAKKMDTEEDAIIADLEEGLARPASWNTLIAPSARTEDSERKMGIRNRVSCKEAWVEVLGRREEDYGRNVRKISDALQNLPGWEHVGSRKHRGRSEKCYQRLGTEGHPTPVGDIAPETNEGGRVVKFEDERRRRI